MSLRTILARVLGAGRPEPPVSSAATDADRRHMARALELAGQAAREGEVPVGAVVYRTATGEVLGEGFNRRERDGDPSAHAEFIAILAACRRVGDWRLNDCTCVVTLEPCPMCAGLLVNARVGRLVYGADDPKAGAVRTLYAITGDRRLNHRVEVVSGVEGERAGGLLREFFRSLRAGRQSPP